ncbi:hypothetical protein [Pararhodobacter sp. SW119]|uniref:hypothetical protein n=1 Tax=Pararhodobacter sp. SW119 TaxID=2780075 RepID=UPI001ADF2F39|nr:hypothetical protein [Pararhodobacter sp. SW119]
MRQAAPLLLAMGLSAPAAADTPEKAAAFLGAMRDAGCDLSLEGADNAAEALGIEIAELDDILDLLYLGGQLTIDEEDHLTLMPSLCATDGSGDAALFARLQEEIDLDAHAAEWLGMDALSAGILPPARAARVVAAIRANDCAVTREEAEVVMTAAEIAPAESYAATAAFFEAGHLYLDAGPDAFRLTDAVCAADPAGDAALYDAAIAQLTDDDAPADADAMLAERFGPDGVRAVLEFLADTSDCVLDTSDRVDTVDSVVAFMSLNMTGVYNLPPDFSPAGEADLRATIAQMLDAPGPAFVTAPGQLTLIDCTP